MAYVVVDTDVLSYCFKGDSRAAAYEPFLKGHMLIVSFVTVAELNYWAKVRRWRSKRIAQMKSYLAQYLIYHSNDALCQRWADLIDQARRKGRTLAPADAWIAATAVEHSVPLVTHNSGDFQYLNGLTVQTASGA